MKADDGRCDYDTERREELYGPGGMKKDKEEAIGLPGIRGGVRGTEEAGLTL